jgi:lysophospholipase L1-like esterase
MTRAHTWMLLALAVGCSSENTDDPAPISTTYPAATTAPPEPTGPVGSTTPGPVTSQPVTPVGPTGGVAPVGPTGGSGPVAPIPSTTGPTPTTPAPEPTTPAPVTTTEEPDVTSAPAGETSEPVDETSDEPAAGECVKGTTAGNEVVFIGESFIALSSIPEETAKLAIANGSLKQGEQYHDFSVSGTRMGDGAIPRQYTQAQAQHNIRYVLMNGGGNDCLQANDPNAPIPAAEKLFQEMAADGVEKIVYFFYPDAGGGFAGGSLQTCLNQYRPKIKALCDGLTAPKCYWVDLAETEWKGNESAFTSDGIHPNGQGSVVTAKAIWNTMVENCVAQ